MVMSGDQGTPAMTVSWPMESRGKPKLRIRVIGHADMPPGTSWELWMLPGADQKPVSLGLIGTAPTQELTIPAQLAPMINRATGLAMSQEPAGGSPTGLPTGPVLYKGPVHADVTRSGVNLAHVPAIRIPAPSHREFAASLA